ncbi:aspartate aminotransferase [Fusarium venenatum]|uniref:aspartate aminotransferase n=1 Tax=Fusarium venenatum TaxID=56646 RepID=UPI001DADD0C3|nr:aspartate aminotransferase [Fusarium venenatum]
MSTDCISSRGAGFLPDVPKFFDVLNNLWHPQNNPDGIVNLGLAENALMQEELTSFINSHLRVDSHALTYGDGFTGSKLLKTAFCQLLNDYFNPIISVIPSHLTITPGVGNAIECCAWSLFNRGDQVLIGRPYWTAFNYIFRIRAGVQVREVSFNGIDPFGLEAVEEYEKEYIVARAEGRNVQAILLCSPHNPLGRCYTKQVLMAYMRLCGKFGIHLLVDEIYALSVFENSEMNDAIPFTSILSLSAEGLMEPGKIHVQWGLSKDFGATGLRIGCLISQSNPLFHKSLESFSLFNLPSSLADIAAASLLMDKDFTDNYLSLHRSRLAKCYKNVTGFLQRHGIPYRKSNASLFLMVNLTAAAHHQVASDDDILALLRKENVHITSASGYRSEDSGWFRLVIAHPQHVLDEGLKRILQALS